MPRIISTASASSAPAFARAMIHALSGVVTVGTAEGTWVVPPGRGVWLPAGIEHALRFAGQVRMRTLFIARRRATYRGTAGWWTCRRCCGN